MIAKVVHGHDVKGLMRYLMGPGRHNEHSNQHVLASSRGDWIGKGPESTAALGRWLNAGNEVGQDQGRPPARVWHCSVALPPGERLGADTEASEQRWEEAATRIMTRLGLHGNAAAGGGVRWAAIHHGLSGAKGEGGDHIHIAVVLCDLEGTPRIPFDDYRTLREVCRELEAEWELRSTSPADGTANTAPTTAERQKAERLGEPVTDREWLQVEVKALAASTTSLEDLIEQADARGILAAPAHVSKQGTPYGIVFGRAVRDSEGNPVRDDDGKLVLPKDADGKDITFAGRSLAKDLSLPKLQARWQELQDNEAAAQVPDPLEQARKILDEAAKNYQPGSRDAESVARAAADTVAVLAVSDPNGDPDGKLAQAAQWAAHAGREAGYAVPKPMGSGAAVRMSTIALMAARVGGADRDLVRTLQLLRVTAQMMDSLARLRQVQGHRRQAMAARQAAKALTGAEFRSIYPNKKRPIKPPTATIGIGPRQDRQGPNNTPPSHGNGGIKR